MRRYSEEGKRFAVNGNLSRFRLSHAWGSLQSAPLQEWRDSDNELAALITPEGSAFFREMGIAAKVGGTVVSHFFQLEGLNKFALSAVDGVFDILRYDDFGVFKDRPFRVLRAGNILTTVGVEINDLTVGPGTLKLFGDYADLPSTTIPSSPAIGNARVFLNNVSGELSVRKDNGSIVSLESGGGGGGGGSFSVFADAETPTGAINGSNVTFTLATAPNPAASLELHNNGVGPALTSTWRGRRLRSWQARFRRRAIRCWPGIGPALRRRAET